MEKVYKRTVLVTCLLCLLPIIAGILLWDKLPNMMPVHFNVKNEADNFLTKGIAVFALPSFLAALELFCAFLSTVDPKKEGVAVKGILPFLWMMPLISWVVCGITYITALGYSLNVSSIIFVLIGFIFIILGLVLPVTIQNYTIGVRTPWALNDKDNWNYTKKVGSISLLVGGSLITALAIISFFTLMIPLYIVSFIIIILSIMIPIISSYRYYKNKRDLKLKNV